MRPLLIVKAGSTFPELVRTHGDFEAWAARGLGLATESLVRVDVQAGTALPNPEAVSGCVITGSHDNVTDRLPWMAPLARWLRNAAAAELPILGICFGHQILAEALGGRSGFHPQGPEIGTTTIHLTNEARSDPIFFGLPPRFPAHVTHMQTVLALPDGATLLARSDHDPHHAFRFGRCAWGVQFHPEFTVAAARFYVDAQADVLARHGLDAATAVERVVDAPDASNLLATFAEHCTSQSA